jgi:tyrosinase
VFFLHHTQLDRLWWMWQGVAARNRGKLYTGKKRHNSTADASIDDIIPMGNLAPDVRVNDIIGTGSGLLCYRY